MAHGILFPIGCYRVDLADILEAVFKSDNAFGMNAVVIGEENDRGRILTKKRRWNKHNFGNRADLVPNARPRYSSKSKRRRQVPWRMRKSLLSDPSCYWAKSSTLTRPGWRSG